MRVCVSVCLRMCELTRSRSDETFMISGENLGHFSNGGVKKEGKKIISVSLQMGEDEADGPEFPRMFSLCFSLRVRLDKEPPENIFGLEFLPPFSQSFFKDSMSEKEEKI